MLSKPASLAVLLLVHGVNAASGSTSSNKNACQPGDANNLALQLDQYNELLVNYANLGSKVLADASSSTSKLLAAATPTNKPKNHVLAHNNVVAPGESNEQHKKQKQHTGLAARAEPSEPQLAAHHTHAAQNQHATVQLVAVRSSSPHQQAVQNTWNQLKKQQRLLNNVKNVCLSSSDTKVASSMERLLGTYVDQEHNLKAAGNLVVVPPKKNKSKKKASKAERMARRAAGLPSDYVKRDDSSAADDSVPQTAGWLTMGDDVNGGYNGDQSVLTSSPSTSVADTTSTTDSGATNSFQYVGQPQQEYSQVMVTVTSTSAPSITAPPPPPPASSAKHKSSESSSDDSSSDSTSGSDTESSSEDESSMGTMPKAPAPATTSKAHHNIITGTIDGTFSLITGTLHFFEHLLGLNKIFLEESKQVNKLFSDLQQSYKH